VEGAQQIQSVHHKHQGKYREGTGFGGVDLEGEEQTQCFRHLVPQRRLLTVGNKKRYRRGIGRGKKNEGEREKE